MPSKTKSKKGKAPATDAPAAQPVETKPAAEPKLEETTSAANASTGGLKSMPMDRQTAAAILRKSQRVSLMGANDQQLTQQCSTALLEIFARFDDDEDNALNRDELENFAIATNGEKFEEEAVAELKKSFNVDEAGNLTKRGFLEMYHRDLIKHGYSVKLQLVRRVTGNADPNWKKGTVLTLDDVPAGGKKGKK
ncbi:hypothetical protein HK101_010144 [Irineochytrium annulatum]|nr:hypothetical protein HK101_010144 [Irineochytrium annulatum]